MYLVPVDKLSLFDNHVRESKKYEYTGKNLIINKFVEITEEKTEHEIKYIATLKKQPHENKDGKITGFEDKRFLLLTDNGHLKKRCINIPVIQLAPEYEINLEYYRANKTLEYMENSSTYLLGLQHCTKNKDDNATIAKTLKLIEKEIYDQQLITDELFNSYIDKRNKYK